MIPLNYHHLYYFFMIAQEGSVLAAARKLRLSQPALSAQLKQFEFFLEKPLFHRGGRKLILTEEGHVVLAYAKTIFDTGQELLDHLGDTRQHGRLRIQIGVSQDLPPSVTEQVLKWLYAKDPACHIQLSCAGPEPLLVSLQDHFLDFVLTMDPGNAVLGPEIERHRISDLAVEFCAAPQLAKKVRRFPQDLRNVPLILPSPQNPLCRQVLESFEKWKISPLVRGEIQDAEIRKRMALRGIGVTVLNRATLSSVTRRGSLEVFNAHGMPELKETVSLLRKKRKRTHPLAEDFLKNFRLSVS